MSATRLLFASCHCYIDPSSGAALATRDLLELLASDGFDCRVLSTGVLDYEQETSLEDVLGSLDVPFSRADAALESGYAVPVFDLELNGVRATLMPTRSSRAEKAPDREEGWLYLDLADHVLDRFRPRVLLTYGGHPANLELMRRARKKGIKVVFHLHNFAYGDRSAFGNVSAFLVPSEYTRKYYARKIGIESTAIPYPLHPERVVAKDPEPRYVTFVNPQPAKGVTVFARIAAELDRKRPEIPLLVVEGRGVADGLANAGLDLSRIRNLHRMANTPDPRDFYRVTRALLVPSLWCETFGRVAAEGLANGLPVLASDRGALPETLGDAGFLFTIPERCTPHSGEVPTSREVAPWIATIERLWDDAEFESRQRDRAEVEASRWKSEHLKDTYAEYFSQILAHAVNGGVPRVASV